MFSNLILRNSRRSRKENGLFFSSLVISIVAFYMILSISTQDVMLFLQKMESDAVDKLLLLIPAFYGMTLGILFFLIYFACKYQFERRRHEFGVYLMLGMRRSKLFGMLLAEDFLTSYNIDRSRVYAEGYSGGGEIMSRVMEKRPELFAAYLHCSSQWDGAYGPVAESRTPVYIVVG